VKIPTPKSPLQFVAALAILGGFYGALFLPAFSSAKLDPGMVEICKSVTLILIGWLFGNAMQSPTNTPPAVPAPPKEPTP
jgi:hypothetical protein